MKPCLKTAAAREQKNAERGGKPRGGFNFNILALLICVIALLNVESITYFSLLRADEQPNLYSRFRKCPCLPRKWAAGLTDLGITGSYSGSNDF
jgi:hypothetical protein